MKKISNFYFLVLKYYYNYQEGVYIVVRKIYFMMSLLLLCFLAACQESNNTEQVTQSKQVSEEEKQLKTNSSDKEESEDNDEKEQHKKNEEKQEKIPETSLHKKELLTSSSQPNVLENYQVDSIINGYVNGLVEGINTNSFSKVEPYLQPGSSLYDQQKALVSDLYSSGIREEVVSVSVDSTSGSGENYHIQTTERIKITKPDGSTRTADFSWKYSAVLKNGELKLADIKEVKSSQTVASSEAPIVSNKEESLSAYNGTWGTGENDGSPFITLEAVKGNIASVSIESCQPPNCLRLTDALNENAEFINGKTSFTYDEDGQGNQGAVHVTLRGDSIVLTVQETYRASDAFWFIPEGTFTLHHIEDITAIVDPENS